MWDDSASHWSLTPYLCECFQTCSAWVMRNSRAVASCLGWRGKLSPHRIESLEICLIQLWVRTILNLFLFTTLGKVMFVSTFDQQVNMSICPFHFGSPAMAVSCGFHSMPIYFYEITPLPFHSWVTVMLCNVAQRPCCTTTLHSQPQRQHLSWCSVFLTDTVAYSHVPRQ